jgi:hypothetical protein
MRQCSRTTIILLALAIAIIQCSETIAQESKGRVAWRNAKWGMTEEEVLAAFPGEVHQLENPGKLPSGSIQGQIFSIFNSNEPLK